MRCNNGGYLISVADARGPQPSETLLSEIKGMSVSSLLLRDCGCGATMANGQQRVAGFCKIHSCPFALKRATLGVVHTSVGPHCPVVQGTDPSSCLKGISKRNVGQIPRRELNKS